MKSKVSKFLESCRITEGPFASDESFGFNGQFKIKHKHRTLRVVVSDQLGWDHVSVSMPNKCPSWNDMNFIKDLFFDESETVIQFHPKKSDYVNFHPFTLHLWRKHGHDYELPPNIMV